MEDSKKLSVVIPIQGSDSSEDIINTIISVPWISEIKVILYTDSSERVYDILRSNKMDSTSVDPDGETDLLICEIPGDKNLMKNISIEDLDTDFITFLEPGSEILDLNPEFFRDCDWVDNLDSFFLMGRTLGEYMSENNDSISLVGQMAENKILPLSTHGCIFSLKYLKEHKDLRFDENSETEVEFLSILFDHMEKVLGLNEEPYKFSWCNLDDNFIVEAKPNGNTSKEMKVISEILEFWKSYDKKDENPMMKELLWNRISRSAAFICQILWDRPTIISNYHKYLYKDNMNNILHY